MKSKSAGQRAFLAVTGMIMALTSVGGAQPVIPARAALQRLSSQSLTTPGEDGRRASDSFHGAILRAVPLPPREHRSDRKLGNYIAIGALAGAALGSVVGVVSIRRSSCNDCMTPDILAPLLGAGIGAGLGGIVGAIVYAASRPTDST